MGRQLENDSSIESGRRKNTRKRTGGDGERGGNFFVKNSDWREWGGARPPYSNLEYLPPRTPIWSIRGPLLQFVVFIGLFTTIWSIPAPKVYTPAPLAPTRPFYITPRFPVPANVAIGFQAR